MAATRGDGSTDVPVSVAELCRRLGSAPATTDSVSTGATPVLVGDLLRREGRPPVRAEVPAARVAPSPETEPEPDADQPGVPTPRSRGDACRTALGAGGLVVAGSVLGAALLAAAGVGGPLPFGQGGDDGAGQFQGEGTLVKPGTAYGSVRGRDVVARSGLLRAIAYYTPFRSTDDPAPGTRAAGVVTAAAPAGPVRALAPAGAAVPAGPAGGIVTPVVSGVTHATDPVTEVIAPVIHGVTHTADPVVTGVAQAAAPVVDALAQGVSPVVAPVAAVVAPAATVIAPVANEVARAATPVAELVGTTTGPVLENVTPLVNAAAPAVSPVVAATESVIQPVLAVSGPAVALGAAGSVLDLADPLLPSLPGELTDPVVSGDPPAAPGSFAQAATGNVVSAVRDAAAVTTSAVQGATDAARPVLPVDPSETARRVAARGESPVVDPPTLPIPIVPSQAAGYPEQTAVDPADVLTKIVPLQATGSPAAAADTTLPTRVLSSRAVDGPETTEAQTRAEAEPPTEPLQIVTPLDDPDPSAEPRTAPLRVVAPEKSDERAESKPDADTPAPRSLPAAEALKDKASALLGR